MRGAASDVLVVYVTVPPDKGSELARALVERGVAACVNEIPGVRSFYRWQGKLQDDVESLLIIKTTRAKFEALRAAVVELHPYDVPEVIALPLVAGHGPYVDWIHESLGGGAA